MNFLSLDYLLQGNARQQAAYHALKQLAIFEDLASYSPVLVGTFPLAIDIPSSDLDILLQAQELEKLAEKIQRLYGQHSNFQAWFTEKNSLKTYVANFEANAFIIELFAQDKPVLAQNGYCHLLIEHRLLNLAKPAARESIRQFKQDGLKTEPAFAHYFGIEGNPYAALLEMADWEDTAIIAFLKQKDK